ncbi:hypothetical protein [Dyadobacter aurulentus]|uniref:hypothetical protein n=1 Tax=Dyadobacter sp. UC 10 TaxID=2605428 RepID=UPI0011F1F3C3|nr:hypothetical protein [Dyadobacter sp. UC 10]KAA0992774.1 hypothetical protein FXO21_22645 [Dyadobacter sp. UC 10]
MTKKEKEQLLIVGGVLAVVLLLSRKSGSKTIDVTSDFVIEAYRDLITSPSDMTYQGVPLHIYLARNTTNYDAVKYAYNSTYGGNFTEELTSRLAGQKLADYVAELLKTGQLITP